MVDCIGKELKIGDKVVCSDARYADLLIGEIIKFTPKKAFIQYHRTEYGRQYTSCTLKESFQIFKYEDGMQKIDNCDVCNGKSIITQDCDNGYSLEVDREQQEITVWFGDECLAVFSINYCPGCGRKLLQKGGADNVD